MEPLAVRLRPFEEGDLWYFDRWANDREFSAPFEWGGFTSPESWRRRWHDDRLLGASPYCLVIAAVDDDSFVGSVDWRQNDRPGPGVWEIGILIVPEYRGRGAGSEAQRQLVDYLFSTTPCHRIWAGTEIENIAEQHALERAGLLREGCVRGAHFRDGRWRDSYIYGITRNDWRHST
ncbi:MAG: GNAT family N-acetyltransferase [Acidimicrobiales bacterium]